MPLPFLMGAFPAGAAAASAPSGAAITLAGSLSATASASTITSTPRAVTVPVGNTGIIRCEDVADLGAGGTNFLIRRNSLPFQAVTENLEIEFDDTDTITLSVGGAMSIGDGARVTLIDATNGSIIATYGEPQLYRV